jgi:hypothetical protein
MRGAKKTSVLILVILTTLGLYEMLEAEGMEHGGLRSTRSIKPAARRCVFLQSSSPSDVLVEFYH